MVQLGFILMGLAGLTMLCFGIGWIIKSFRPRILTRFSMNEKSQTFEIIDDGLYAFCIVGAKKGVSNFYAIQLKDAISNQSIDVKQTFPRFKFRMDWKIAIEYTHFLINQPGKYVVELGDNYHLGANSKNLEGMIVKTIPLIKKVLGIIFLVLGANMTAWGILLGTNPTLFH